MTDPWHPKLLSTPFLTGYTTDAMTFSGDGRHLATIDTTGTARLWDMTTEKQTKLAELTEHTNFINKVVFSPDGASLATVSNQGIVQRWEAATGKLTATAHVHDAHVHEEGASLVALSPDGRILATITSIDDTTITLWDMDHDSEPIATLAGHTGHINTAAFNPDSDILATASNDGTVRLWDLKTSRVTTHLCHIIGHVNEDKMSLTYGRQSGYEKLIIRHLL